MSSGKKKIRYNKMRKNFITRPLLCKIQIIEQGERILDYKGDIGVGYDRIEAFVKEVFQVRDKVEKDDTGK